MGEPIYTPLGEFIDEDSPRGQAYRAQRDARVLVDKLARGQDCGPQKHLPWSEPAFQQAVIAALVNAHTHTRVADALRLVGRTLFDK